MVAPPARRAERRKNLIALLVAAGVIVAALGVTFVPAALPFVGAGKGAVASSVAGELDGDRLSTDDLSQLPMRKVCRGAPSQRLVCEIETIPAGDVGSGALRDPASYDVEVNWMGCWEASRVEGPGPRDLDGCVSVFDY